MRGRRGACGLSDDEQTETSAFDALRQGPRRPIKAAEDALRLVRRNADTLIAHADDREILLALANLDFDRTFSREYFTALSRRFKTAPREVIGIAHHVDGLVGRPTMLQRVFARCRCERVTATQSAASSFRSTRTC
jgi:hypothetical protein